MSPLPDTRSSIASAYGDLVALDGGAAFHASLGDLFSDAVFGRDQAEAAEDLLHLAPQFSARVILGLARLQGTKWSPDGLGTSEEEPGRIPHEARSLFVGDRRIGTASEAILTSLRRCWGGTADRVLYYGSVDATPLYARLVVRHCAHHGRQILGGRYVGTDGEERTVRESLIAALDWVTSRLAASTLGMVEFLRRNPAGTVHQVWRDSLTSYVHRDGSPANREAPIAAVEVQALAYDALTGAAGLLPDAPEGRADLWREAALKLRRAVIAHFWMPDGDFFAMGLDRGPDGAVRQIALPASSCADMLDSQLLLDVPEDERSGYVRAIAARVLGPEFLTEAGIRCRGVSAGTAVPFSDYHGSCAVWPKHTYDVAKGLRRHGLHGAAEQLERRLLNAVAIAGQHLEFFYVLSSGDVGYVAHPRRRRHDMASCVIVGTNVPDHAQLWTVSATLAIKHRRGGAPTRVRSRDSAEFDAQLLASMPGVEPIRSLREARERREQSTWMGVDTTAAMAIQRRFLEAHFVVRSRMADRRESA